MLGSAGLRAVIFDWDGTLIDSYRAHFETYRAALGRFGVELTEKRLMEVYSPNWYRVYEALDLPSVHWSEADAAWLEEIQNHRPGLLPGVREAVSRLRGRFRLAIVTSGSRVRVAEDLSRTGLEGLFEPVVTHEDVSAPKPAPEGLRVALTQLGLRGAEALYVGDADADLEMATEAGVPFVAVEGPFNGPALSANGVHRIPGVRQLPRLLSAD